MNPPVDISVVIVNWNTRDMLLECVESLYAETRRAKLEIIVVDNASHDGSMDALAARFPGVVQIRNTANHGFSKANNQGLRIARGRYLCLVNSDVKALEGVLDRLMDYADAHPDVGLLAPRTVGRDMKLRRNCREYPTLRNSFCQAVFLDKLFPGVRAFRGRSLAEYDYKTAADIEVVSGCFLLIPRRALEQVGLLDERFFIYSEDVDWSRRYHNAGWKVIFYPGAEAIHYGGSSSSVEAIRFNIEKMKASLQYWHKHHGFFSTVLFWGTQWLGTFTRAAGLSVVAVARRQAWRDASGYWKLVRWLSTSGLSLVFTPGRSYAPDEPFRSPSDA